MTCCAQVFIQLLLDSLALHEKVKTILNA